MHPSSSSLSATPWIILVGIQTILSVNVVSAFSATPTPTSRPFIELINPVKTIQDKLPASFVAYWPTWVLDPHTNTDSKFEWDKIPDSEGYVPPTSIDELWQPQDLISPNCQLAVGLHVRDGMIRHVLPAIDLCITTGDDEIKKHRNWGMCSVPRAYQWMDFGAAIAGGFNGLTMELQIRENDSNDNNNDDTDNDDTVDASSSSSEWKTIAEVESVESSINLAIEALASTPPEELGDGSTIIHVLCDTNDVTLLSADDDKETPLQCPLWGSELRVLLLEDDSPVGALQVSVEKTAAGSESEYLPDVYKPLYKDESLRRPAFVETRKRLERKQIEQQQQEEKKN